MIVDNEYKKGNQPFYYYIQNVLYAYSVNIWWIFQIYIFTKVVIQNLTAMDFK